MHAHACIHAGGPTAAVWARNRLSNQLINCCSWCCPHPAHLLTFPAVGKTRSSRQTFYWPPMGEPSWQMQVCPVLDSGSARCDLTMHCLQMPAAYLTCNALGEHCSPAKPWERPHLGKKGGSAAIHATVNSHARQTPPDSMSRRIDPDECHLIDQPGWDRSKCICFSCLIRCNQVLLCSQMSAGSHTDLCCICRPGSGLGYGIPPLRAVCARHLQLDGPRGPLRQAPCYSRFRLAAVWPAPMLTCCKCLTHASGLQAVHKSSTSSLLEV